MSFSANDYEESSGDFAPLPVGEYMMVMVKAERTDSSTAGNEYMNCQFKVVGDTKYKGRIVFHMFHLKNSEACMEMHKNMLKGMMKSAGVNDIKNEWDFEPLMNKPFTAKLKITTDPSGTYDPKNEVVRFISKGAAASTATTSAAQDHGDEPWANMGDNAPEKKKKKKKKEKKGKK